jgi:hypothetical protein
VSLRFVGLQVVSWCLAACLALGSCLVSGCGHSPSASSAVIPGEGVGGSAPNPPPPDFVDHTDGGTGVLGCERASCELLGKNCGAVADGCGGMLECGSCGEAAACGVVSANVCTAFADLCTPAAREVACAGKQCGQEGDGCGGAVDCGSCPEGQTCGSKAAFQCAAPLTGSDEECPARIESCTAVGAECGLVGNGCGGALDCGVCQEGELCGVDAAQTCGAAPVCQPLDAAAACAGKCGFASNGCGVDVNGGVVDCKLEFPCPAGETCGGGGIANECGKGGAVCRPIPEAAACAGRECGAASDGCGGLYVCGDSCDSEEECRAGQCRPPLVCVPTPEAVACAGKACGLVGDGCGGTYGCGTCPLGKQCGYSAPFQCGSAAGPLCQPRGPAEACAGKECGVVYDGCGTTPEHSFDCSVVRGRTACPSGEFCSLVSPFQCAAPQQPVCVPRGDSCAELGWQCGQAINNCGQVFDCGAEGRSCNPFETCTGGITGPTTCVGGVADCALCSAVPSCAADSPTRLTGRVVTPGRTDADTANQIGVPNAFVYILRNANVTDLPAIAAGIAANSTSCDRCSEQDLGPVLASALTDSSGNYALEGNVPVGQNFLLVTKVGKFRRAVVQQLPLGAACGTTALPVALPANPTRLPRSASDGFGVNLPRVAVSTGRIDAMECVFEKMGVAHSEFGNFGSAARVHLYRGGPSAQAAAGARVDNATPFDSALYTSLPRLQAYDMVVADCEGQDWDGENEFSQRIASGNNVREYVNRGGRLFASHLSFSWLHQNGTAAYAANAPISTGLSAAGTWDTNYLAAGNLNTSGTGVVSIGRPAASPRIGDFAAWMASEGVVGAQNQFTITDPRSLVTALGSAAEEFVFRSGGNGRVQQFSFNTPYAAPAAASCGRVAYSGFHVAATGGGDGPFATATFPAHCSGSLTDQEKVLLYMLFDLGACVGDTPEAPACVPRSCPAGGGCGVFPDGCGGQLDCGCVGGKACVNNQCVAPSCVPTTCEAEGVICSSISDGCGRVLDCECSLCQPLTKQQACASVACGTASDGCSGVYLCSECPEGCQPLRACPPDADCGLISDGCDGTLDCGTCASGKSCGAHQPNQCSTPECQPLDCADLGAECGLIGDGCGGSKNCGKCGAGQACVVAGGIPNRCEGCQPRSCEDSNAECGLVGDGCGETADCGPCPAGQICGAEAPNRCGSGPACKPQSCAAAGAECGVVGDGCGGRVDCGPCPAGELCGVERPFQCGAPPACTPGTCAESGAECGALGDGCGAVLDCGVCPPGYTCGIGGANLCRSIR